MKKLAIALTAAALLAVAPAKAQIRTPQPSPGASFKQTVGLTEVAVEYSRPAAKGRVIFGDLVPFDQMWRTGANQSTKVTFSDAVTVNGTAIDKGTYALFSIPGKDQWTLIFAKSTSPLPGPDFKAEDEVARVMAKPVKLNDMVESFTIGMSNVTANTSSLDISWEKTRVSAEVVVEVEKKVLADIERVMAGPSQNDYYAAATYYYESGKDLTQAYEWVEKALVDNERYWIATLKARILAKQGKKSEAVKAAQFAKGLAETAGNKDYVKINDKLIADNK